MRYSTVWAGMGALLVLLSASAVFAGPLDRDATSKPLGNYNGNRAQTRGMNRAFSYAPSTTNNAVPQTATTTEPAKDQANPAPATAERQDNSTRSFSYQAAPATRSTNTLRPNANDPRFFHAERKALGEY